MTDRDVRVRAIQMLAEVFQVEMSDLGVEGYLRALAVCPTPALTGAVDTLLRTKTFFPRPAEWLEAAEAWAHAARYRRRDDAKQLPAETATAALSPEESQRKITAMLDELNARFQWREPAPTTVVDFQRKQAEAKRRLGELA